MKQKTLIAISLIVFGSLLRLWYFLEPISYSVTVTPDESVYGLQAIHILKGDYSIFYWAQPYTGTFSAYLSALLFALTGGPSVLALKLVPFLFSVGFLVMTYLVATRVFKEGVVPLVALGISALGTPFWNNWASRAGTGYPEALLIGEGLLLLALIVLYGKKGNSLSVFFLLGLLTGLGFWIQPTIIYYLLPIIIFLVLANHGFFFHKPFLALVLGFVIGDLPVIYYNFVSNGATGSSLFHFSVRGLKRAVWGLTTEGLPVILGNRTSFSHENFSTPLALIIYGFFLAAVIFTAWQRRFLLRNLTHGFIEASRPFDLILTTFFSTLLIFMMTERFNQFVLEPRYILALYSTLPMILAYVWLKVYKAVPIISWILAGVFLLNSGLGIIKAPPGSFVDRYKLERATTLLSEHGIRYVNSDGALAHRLMFLTNERLIASVREGGLMAARYPQYNQTVLDSPWGERGYLFLKTNSDLAIMENEIRSFVGPYRKELIDNQFVFLYPEKK